MSQFQRHQARCKFCGVWLTIRIADDYPGSQLTSLLAMAACNTCADYRRAMYQLRDKITHDAGVWRNLIISGNQGPKEIQLISEKFEALTKKFCTACCGAHRVANVWSPGLAKSLVDRPQHAYAILKDYEATFKPLHVEPEPEPIPELIEEGQPF